jgi:DNA-binding transcriptional MocR family regulator
MLLRNSPRAAELLHLLVARVGDKNAVVISQKALARLMGRHRNTVIAAVADLVAGRWIETRQIGDRGTVNAYVLNDRVAWSGPRDGIRYSLFSATVIVSDEEQPDREELGQQPALRSLPNLYPNERQLPSGPGLGPPSEPALPGLEPDLPARKAPQ